MITLPETTAAPSQLAEMSSSAVLFLDVDGVLNRVGTRERVPGHGVLGIEQSKCEMIRRILRETGCGVVVSSTWRRYDDLLIHLWEQLGAEAKARWIGETPILDRVRESGIYVAKVRGDEIQAWLDEHPEVSRFVILDDDADMAHLAPHLLRTHGCEGITDEITSAAIDRLNSVINKQEPNE